ncbi:site-specific tyrosine recombinase XerC [Gemmata sp. SH-PL17]|uniref:tyrosine-type recombinase/integrase n=1 Tax=Gemmata sp. SH-PL17 TaxID=1630693 RepID=UPI00078DF7D4|nr:tyrosine-type recombinase/integrase [Gemmata sp. SH-PL17]AMV26273.1 site-specific tyrosine recombinase XerC [Gemmata sp. SH-PL17]
MQKTGSPWYRKGKDSWYVWHDGKQVFLARGKSNKSEAFARFSELLNDPNSVKQGARFTVADLVTEFEKSAAERVTPGTLTAYRSILKPFTTTFGTRDPAELTPPQVIDWASRGKWSSATRRYALMVVCTVYSWAEKLGRVLPNPLKGMKKPPAKSRGAEVLIDIELHARILEVVSPAFRLFLQAVRETGARPGEVARVEAKDVSWDAGCWVLTEHKTARTGRVRTIYLPQSVLSLCRTLADKHPTGPLFRNNRGERWRKTGWKQAMGRAQRKLGLNRRPLTSGYRHTFATDALEAGVPDTHLAELLGHSTTAMIHRHYGHLSEKGRALKNSLDRIRRS